MNPKAKGRAVSSSQCPTCGMLNPSGNRFCGGCGKVLIKGVQILPEDLPYLERVLGKELSQACLADGTWVVVG